MTAKTKEKSGNEKKRAREKERKGGEDREMGSVLHGTIKLGDQYRNKLLNTGHFCFHQIKDKNIKMKMRRYYKKKTIEAALGKGKVTQQGNHLFLIYCSI